MIRVRLVEITWRDSRQSDGKWRWLSDFKAREPVTCVSVGWLIQDDETVKVLAQSMAPDDNDVQYAGDKVIPTCSVVSMRELPEEGDFKPQPDVAVTHESMEDCSA